MTIQLNRNEVLNLMGTLPVNHWLQVRLLDELTALQEPETETVTTTKTPEEHPEQVFVDTHAETKQCAWMFYGQQCKEYGVGEFCENHANKVCNVCQAPADHGCPAELQFVCGYPLCTNHAICESHYYQH